MVRIGRGCMTTPETRSSWRWVTATASRDTSCVSTTMGIHRQRRAVSANTDPASVERCWASSVTSPIAAPNPAMRRTRRNDRSRQWATWPPLSGGCRVQGGQGGCHECLPGPRGRSTAERFRGCRFHAAIASRGRAKLVSQLSVASRPAVMRSSAAERSNGLIPCRSGTGRTCTVLPSLAAAWSRLQLALIWR